MGVFPGTQGPGVWVDECRWQGEDCEEEHPPLSTATISDFSKEAKSLNFYTK